MFDESVQLRIPGPAPVPPQVLRELMKPAINHRGAVAQEVHRRVHEGLRRLFGTQHEVCVLTGSGTAAMEAAVANVVEPGDRVLVLVGGKFGERWGEIARAFGAEVEAYEYSKRSGADPREVARFLREKPDIKAVFATYNESSTGVTNDIEGISRARHEAGSSALLVVDAISILGGAPFPMDQWGVDVAVAGSQKCLMVPPGLSFVAAGERGWQRIEAVNTHRYYLDLRAYRKASKQNQWPYTQGVPLVRALDAALAMLFEEGLEAVFDRHRLMRSMVRSAVVALGLEPWTDDTFASPTVTAIKAPEGIDAEALRKVMRTRYGVEIAGGQGELKGQMWRIGHMGYASPLDMVSAIAALEMALHEAGWRVDLGAGVRAALEVWARWR